MILIRKEKIYNERIRLSEEFKNKYEFIKGFFSDLKEIRTNQQFLQHYRYIQYWNLDFSKMMDEYACKANYCVESLIENMMLSGKDEYFFYYEKLLRNPLQEYEINNNMELNNNQNIFTQLAVQCRPDLIQKYLKEGNPPHDIYTYLSDGNGTFITVKKMMEEGYIPSDDVIIWYIDNSMGGIARLCITECSDKDFIFEETPLDFDSFKIIDEYKWKGNISVDKAREIIHHILRIKNSVDIALFNYLYGIITETLSLSDKFEILYLVLHKNDEFLISTFLKTLDFEGVNRNRIEDMIFYHVKCIKAYIIFNLEIKKNNNYENIIDMCCEIEEDEDDYEKESEISSVGNDQSSDYSEIMEE